MSASALAWESGWSLQGTIRVLRRNGIEWTPDTMVPSLSKVDDDRLRHLYYEANFNTVVLAEMFGVCSKTARIEMHDRGIPLRKGGRPVFPWTKETLHRLYVERRMSLSQIAHHIGGCSQVTVQRQLKKYGIPRRRVGGDYTSYSKRSVGTEATLREMYDSGMSIPHMAERLGRSPSGVRKALVRLKIR